MSEEQIVSQLARLQKWGQYIAQRRIELDLSQRKLARLAKISQGQLSKLEMGQHCPRRDTAVKIADTLGIQGRERDEFLALAGYSTPAAQLISIPSDIWSNIQIVREIFQNGTELFNQRDSDYAVARLYFEKIVGSIPEPSSSELLEIKAWSFWYLASIQHIQNDLQSALYSVQKIKQIGQQLGDKTLELEGVKGLAVTHNNLKLWDKGVEHTQQLLELCEVKPSNLQLIAGTQRDLISAKTRLGDFRNIEKLALTCQDNYEKVGYDRGVVLAKQSLGRALTYNEKFRKAERILVRALGDSQIVDLSALERMILLVTLVDLYLFQGDRIQGKYFASVAKKMGEKYGLTHQVENLSTIVQRTQFKSLEEFLEE